MKNNTVKNIIKVSGLLAIMALAGCGDKLENDFFRQCKGGGTPTKVCQCVWDDLNTKYDRKTMLYYDEHPLKTPVSFRRDIVESALMCAQ